MSEVHASRQLVGKPIISMTNGVALAKVMDIMFDPHTGQVAAVVTSKGGGLLQRGPELEAIPAREVRVWGRDAVLVSSPDVIATQEELPDRQEWLSVSDQIKGRDVISIDGTRIGQLSDVVLDTQGQLVSYELAQVFVTGPVAQSRRIPAGATRSFGQDVLIVDRSQIEEKETTEAHQEEVQTEEPVQGSQSIEGAG
jgi:sporulation protein YlmC with PRC-barrel domain